MSIMSALPATVTRGIDQRRNDGSLAAPTGGRVVMAGAVATVGSVLAAFLLARLGMALFTIPAMFDKLHFAGYAVLTVGGVVGATIAWALVSRFGPQPEKLLTQLAVVVTAVLLLPDLWLFTQPGNPVGPVSTLIVMHLAIGLIALVALLRLAPVQKGSYR